jgi:hypothetical protein
MHAEHSRGFVTIATVMVLLAITVSSALVVFMTAWQSADSQASWMSRTRARGLADACAETARAQLWQDPAYAGSESFSFALGSCDIFPVTVASATYEVVTQGWVFNTVARTRTQFDITTDASGSVQTLEAVLFERVAEF